MSRYTIDDLARRTGTSARNLRALQAKGILRAPELVGRTGYYGDRDLRIVQATLRLQARGHSLAGIADLVQAWDEGATLDDVLGLPASRRRRRTTRGEEFDWAPSFNEFPARAARARLAVVPGFLLDAIDDVPRP